MKQRTQRSLSAALLISVSGIGVSHACSPEPYIASVCVMTWPRSTSFGNGTYAPANGAVLPISNYNALYALIGVTYGGNGTSNFQLPDLRGRVIVGAGQYLGSGPPYVPGQTGGNSTVALTNAQLPPHNHGLVSGPTGVTATTGLGTLAAATTLTGLTATTSLSSVTATAAGSGLALNGSTGGNLGTNPSGSSLGSYTGAVKVYSDAAPTVAMKAGSISGSAPVTFSGSPTTTVSGNPTTTLSGAPSVTVSGVTAVTGSGTPVNTMPPFLVLSYYIAVNGMFPTSD